MPDLTNKNTTNPNNNYKPNVKADEDHSSYPPGLWPLPGLP